MRLHNLLRREVIHMIELYLSTDGKHTVHVSAETPEELTKLVPAAKTLYQTVLSEFGSKVPSRNGAVSPGKRVDTVEQAQQAVAPRCPTHNEAMVYRKGRRGPFWSCPVREADGKWCGHTQEVSQSQNGKHTAA